MFSVFSTIFLCFFATLDLQEQGSNQKWVSDLTAVTGPPPLHLPLYCEHSHIWAVVQELIIPKQTLNAEKYILRDSLQNKIMSKVGEYENKQFQIFRISNSQE